MLGSLLLVAVLTGGLGSWMAPIALVWVGCGAAGLTCVGERFAVRVAFRFRRPSPEQAAALQPLWEAALRLSATPASRVDLYVQRSRRPNAYAAGGRSVAVTSRALEDYRAGRLTAEQMVAVLVHELGHHATRATQPMLVATWLAAPWCVAVRLVTGLAGVLSGRPSQRAVQTLVLSGITVAVVRAVQQGHWMVGGVLGALVLFAVICPLADAAVCRRAEFAADRFAADYGVGPELATALRRLSDGSSTTLGWARRLLASHPTAESRISALRTATDAVGSVRGRRTPSWWTSLRWMPRAAAGAFGLSAPDLDDLAAMRRDGDAGTSGERPARGLLQRHARGWMGDDELLRSRPDGRGSGVLRGAVPETRVLVGRAGRADEDVRPVGSINERLT
jgi:STE24 endopeptidase